MKLRFLVPCLTLALMTIAARAQIGVYVNPVGVHVSSPTSDTGPFSFLGDNVKSGTFYGVNIGGYDDFFHKPKYDLGIDLRDSFSKRNNASLNSFLVGVRVSTKTSRYALRPYLQFSAGLGTTKPPTSTARINRGAYGVLGGVDYTLAKHIDFRVVELGYGWLSTVNSQDFNGVTAPPTSSLFSVSTGLVFRFH